MKEQEREPHVHKRNRNFPDSTNCGKSTPPTLIRYVVVQANRDRGPELTMMIQPHRTNMEKFQAYNIGFRKQPIIMFDDIWIDGLTATVQSVAGFIYDVHIYFI